MKTNAIELVNSNWGNGSRVGDEPSRGVIPDAIAAAGLQPRRQAFCSPPVISLGPVSFDVARQNGGCSDRDHALMVTEVDLLTL